MEVQLAPPPRPSTAITAETWAMGLLAGLDALVGLWAVRAVYSFQMTPDTMDADSEHFDPHGVLMVAAIFVALMVMVTLPLLVARLAVLRRLRHGRSARGVALAALALGGLVWVVTGVLSLWLDAAGAELVAPMRSEPNGSGPLRPLGHFMIVGGTLWALVFGLRWRTVGEPGPRPPAGT